MTAEAIIFHLLSSAAPVTAVVGAAGVWPEELPEDKPAPALVYRLISQQAADDVALLQPVRLMQARVQVDAITSSDAYAQRKALVLAARRACHGTVGAVAGITGVAVRALNDGPDLRHTRAGLSSSSVDFWVVFHQAA
jgi:hypothetical protein